MPKAKFGDAVPANAGDTVDLEVELTLGVEITSCPDKFSLADVDGKPPKLEVRYKVTDPDAIKKKAALQVIPPGATDPVASQEFAPAAEGTVAWDGKQTTGAAKGRYVFQAEGKHKVRIVVSPTDDLAHGATAEKETEIAPAIVEAKFSQAKRLPKNKFKPADAPFKASIRTRGVPDGKKVTFKLFLEEKDDGTGDGKAVPDSDAIKGLKDVEVRNDRAESAEVSLDWHDGIFDTTKYFFKVDGLDGSSPRKDPGWLDLQRHCLVIGNAKADLYTPVDSANFAKGKFSGAGWPVADFIAAHDSAWETGEKVKRIGPSTLDDHQENKWAFYIDGHGSADSFCLYTYNAAGHRYQAHWINASTMNGKANTPRALVFLNTCSGARSGAWALKNTLHFIAFATSVDTGPSYNFAKAFFNAWIDKYKGDPAKIVTAFNDVKSKYEDLKPVCS